MTKPVPRLHADLIKAWADGATIQLDTPVGIWEDVTGVPIWDNRSPLRIKPREFPKSSLSYMDLCGIVNHSVHMSKTTNEGTMIIVARNAANVAVRQYILDQEAILAAEQKAALLDQEII